MFLSYNAGEIFGFQIDISDPKSCYNYILLLDDLAGLMPKEIDICEENDVPVYFTNMIELIGNFLNEPTRWRN